MNESDWPKENSLALGTRLKFMSETIKASSPKCVLDIGCGTGEQLTYFLAMRFPDIQFHGIDQDQKSIDYARRKYMTIRNLKFDCHIPELQRYDAVIASEVIEHVVDPNSFLITVREILNPGGLLLLTLPNGYGCSEIMSMLENLLFVTGVIPLLKKVKRKWSREKQNKSQCDTLAISPHINFFSFSRIETMFDLLGFRVISYRGRMFLHNFIASTIIDKSSVLAQWNIRMGQKLPPCLVADWMFALHKDSNKYTAPRPVVYKRNWYEKFKVSLNCRRWGINDPNAYLMDRSNGCYERSYSVCETPDK